MVGRFTGWFMNILLCQIEDHYSIAWLVCHVLHLWHYKIISFLWPDFNMKVVSISFYMENYVSGSPLQVPFARLFIFKVNSVSNSEVRWRTICCLLCILNLFFSNASIDMASARWCISRFRPSESGLLRNYCMGSSSWCRGWSGSLL